MNATSDPEFDQPLKSVSFRKWYWVLVFSLCVFGAGVIILIKPDTLYQVLAYLIGGGLLLSGIYKLFFDRPHTFPRARRSFIDILWGVTTVIVALVLFLNPGLVKIALPVSFGIIVLLYSFLVFSLTKNFSDSRLSKGLKFSGIVSFLIALTAFIYPEAWGDILGRGMGVFLILIGIGGGLLSLYLKKAEWNIISFKDIRDNFNR